MARLAVFGIPEIDAKLQRLGAKIGNKIVRGALRNAAKEMATEVKNEVPVETGTLKKGIKVKAIKRSRTRMGMQVVVEDQPREDGESHHVASFVEYGTSHNEANPFMRRSLDQKGDDVKKTAMDGLEAAILKAIDEVTKE